MTVTRTGAARGRVELVNRARLDMEMQRAGLDAVIACSPSNVFYLSRAYLDDQRDRDWDGMAQFVFWPLGAEPALIVSKSAEGQARRLSWIGEIRSYDWPSESPVPLLVEKLAACGGTRGRVGVELSSLTAATHTELIGALSGAQLSNCGEVLERTRAIKTPGEIELLARAARMTERAIQAGFMASRAGDRERDVAERIVANLIHSGAQDVSVPWLGVGANATTRRRRPSDDPLTTGEVVRVDFGGWFDGMASDITRLAVVGVPSPRQRDMCSRVRDIQSKLLEEMGSGASCVDLYASYRRRIEAYDLPFSGGILAHGIGTRVHEYPIVLGQSTDALLEEGMVMAIEPSITLKGEAKYTLEDLVLIGDRRAVRLSDFTDTSEMFVIEE
jgi:Xaa-Pro aminopeptidase